MLHATSPATQLHEVVVINEQTREEWSAGRAAIQNGRIVVAGSRIRSLAGLELPAATFTIIAKDGGNRRRFFPNVKLVRDASRPPKRYVFL
jgi:hypothetical protein